MKLCSIEGCGKKHKGHGYCTSHWSNWRKTGSPFGKRGYTKPRAVLVTMNIETRALYARWVDLRRSRGSGVVPEWENDFDAFLKGVGTRPSKNHRLYTFQRGQVLGPATFQWRESVGVERGPDEDALAFRRRYQQARQAKFGTTQLDGQLRKKYGDDFGVATFNSMLGAQNGLCAICQQKEMARGRKGGIKLLAVDHDHQTKQVRGLLCQACNRMLGYARDDRGILTAAIAYLDKYGSKAYPFHERPHADGKSVVTPDCGGQR